LPDGDITGKNQFMDLLTNAQVCNQVMNDSDIATDAVVVFAVTCLKRDQQLLTAMLVNCCLWWPLRKYWRLVIVTFDDDTVVQRNLALLLQLPLDTGNVTLASGGQMGRTMALTRDDIDQPVWMPKLPQEALPGGETETSIGMPYLQYWHACTAKNTSHAAAVHAYGTQICLVNLDCDQLVPFGYVQALLKTYSAHKDVTGFVVRCVKTAGSLTGRLAYRAEDFIHLNGYDEEDTPPSGGQDVDLRTRLDQLHKSVMGTGFQSQWQFKTEELCGIALPNDFRDTSEKHDRGWSKVCNVDPAYLKKLGVVNNEKAWNAMNTKGWQMVYAPRIERRVCTQ